MEIAWLDRTHARVGWAALILAVALVAIGSLINESTYAGGYQPFEGADWQFYAEDLPTAWSGFEKSPAFSRIKDAAPEKYANLQLSARKLTGIRWTPSRFRIWFSHWMVASGKGDQTVFFVRPNWIAQIALEANEWVGRTHREGDFEKIGGFYLYPTSADWFVGTSPEILRAYFAQLQPAADAYPSALAEATLKLDAQSTLTVHFEEELRLILTRIASPAPTASRSQHLALDWPVKPIAAVSTRDFGLWDPLFPDNWPDFPGSKDLKRIWADFETLLPPNWRSGADTTQFALFAVDTSEMIPVPDVAVYARSDTPLPMLAPPPSAILYEWSENAGWMTPWLGEGASLYVSASERSRIFANQESTMAKIMAHERVGKIASDEATIEIDAPRLATVLSALARRAASEELWPERNVGDIEHDVIPWLNALGALGEIRLEGKYEYGGLTLRGGTHAPEKPAENSK